VSMDTDVTAVAAIDEPMSETEVGTPAPPAVSAIQVEVKAETVQNDDSASDSNSTVTVDPKSQVSEAAAFIRGQKLPEPDQSGWRREKAVTPNFSAQRYSRADILAVYERGASIPDIIK
jgi:hypothetical protein